MQQDIINSDLEIWHSRVPNLTWTHYRTLLSVTDDDARYWYIREASTQSWSVRTLARNVGSQYYHRLLQSPKKEALVNEMLQLTAPLHDEPQGFLKDPVVAEFLQPLMLHLQSQNLKRRLFAI